MLKLHTPPPPFFQNSGSVTRCDMINTAIPGGGGGGAITVSVNSAAFAGKWLPAISTGGNYNNRGNCQCQLLAVVGFLSTMKIVVDGSFCRNQHFLVWITCRNRVIPGLESAGQWRAIAAVIVVSSCCYRRQPAKSSTTVFTETVITRNTVKPVFKGHCDEGTTCDQGTLSQNGVLSSAC